MVIIDPSFVLGPGAISEIPEIIRAWILPLIHEDTVTLFSISSSLPCVHIEDLCQAYIFMYENPDVNGRHICRAELVPMSVVAEIARSKHSDIKWKLKRVTLQIAQRVLSCTQYKRFTNRGTVVVTGASGFLGSLLVHRLLERGYTVRATVRNPDDDRCTKPILENLPSELAQNLRIFKADLLVDGDFDAVVDGCEGVFHLASPVKSLVKDYQKEILDPAVNGTLNLLKSSIKCGTVKRFVHTSSSAAMLAPVKIVDESCWTDADLFIKTQPFLGWDYAASKTLQERAATEFAKEHNLDMVVINPSFVLGPFKVSQIPISTISWILPLIHEGAPIGYNMTSIPCVHIEDVCRAYIFLYENPDAKGRYICSTEYVPLSVMADIARSKHPDINFCFKGSKCDGPLADGSVGFDSSKLKGLGFEYHHNLEQMIDDSITSCKQKGLLQALIE